MSSNAGDTNLGDAPNSQSGEAETLSVGEKIGYGLGDTASNFYWKLFENFQLYFYTDVFGISAAAAGTMFLVTKIWDAINDPLVGFVSDRTRTAWGRFRPYLLWMSIPFAITGILTFYTPDLSDRGKLIYAYITYTAVFMAYTAINIPYGALLGVISSNSLERTTVSTYRFILAFMGGLCVQLFTNPLVKYFGGTKIIEKDGVMEEIAADPQTGFFWTVVCYAVAAVILFTITFLTTRERVQPEQSTNPSFASDLTDLLKNRPWIVLLFVGLFQILAGWTRGSATGYYFNYFAEIDGNYLLDLGSWGKYFDIGDFGFFFFAGSIFGILGMFFTKSLVKIFGNKWLMILMMLGNAICMASFYWIEADQVGLMYLLHCFGAFITGPMPILLWAMYADAADYSEWMNHRRATGLVFAAATFSQKLGSALGAAVPGWLLGASGFVAPIDNVPQPQSEETVGGIVSMMSIFPAVFLVAGCVAMLFYNLSTERLQQIEADLKKRKKANQKSKI